MTAEAPGSANLFLSGLQSLAYRPSVHLKVSGYTM